MPSVTPMVVGGWEDTAGWESRGQSLSGKEARNPRGRRCQQEPFYLKRTLWLKFGGVVRPRMGDVFAQRLELCVNACWWMPMCMDADYYERWCV